MLGVTIHSVGAIITVSPCPHILSLWGFSCNTVPWDFCLVTFHSSGICPVTHRSSEFCRVLSCPFGLSCNVLSRFFRGGGGGVLYVLSLGFCPVKFCPLFYFVFVCAMKLSLGVCPLTFYTSVGFVLHVQLCPLGLRPVNVCLLLSVGWPSTLSLVRPLGHCPLKPGTLQFSPLCHCPQRPHTQFSPLCHCPQRPHTQFSPHWRCPQRPYTHSSAHCVTAHKDRTHSSAHCVAAHKDHTPTCRWCSVPAPHDSTETKPHSQRIPKGIPWPVKRLPTSTHTQYWRRDLRLLSWLTRNDTNTHSLASKATPHVHVTTILTES